MNLDVKYMDRVLDEIRNEIAFARDHFNPMQSAHEGYAVILEEVDELWDDVKDNKSPNQLTRMRKEAIQVAAMAICFIMECT